MAPRRRTAPKRGRGRRSQVTLDSLRRDHTAVTHADMNGDETAAGALEAQRRRDVAELGVPVKLMLQAWLKGLERSKHLNVLTSLFPVPPFDGMVDFREAEHEYLDTETGRKFSISVTGFVHAYFGEFRENDMISRILHSGRWRRDPSYKYHKLADLCGMFEDVTLEDSRDENHRMRKMISSFWDVNRNYAAEEGTRLHAYVEAFYNGHRSPLRDILVKEDDSYRQFHAYHREHVERRGLVQFRTELLVWDRVFDIAGQVDMLYRTQEDHEADRPRLLLYDWKRSSEIRYKGYSGEKGSGICGGLEDCNYYQYSLQLNVYRYLIERNSVFRVTEMALVVFHPNQTSWALHPVKDMQELVEAMFNERVAALYGDESESGSESENADES